MNISEKELKTFLIAANKAGYVTGEEKAWKKEKDGSTTIVFSHGDWNINDNFFGGEPYGGRVIVSYKQKPYWIMVYYGWVKEKENPDTIYSTLRKALAQMPFDYPFRGPPKLIDDEYRYENSWTGDINRYEGKEKIMKQNTIVYEAFYRGGLVDQRKGV